MDLNGMLHLPESTGTMEICFVDCLWVPFSYIRSWGSFKTFFQQISCL